MPYKGNLLLHIVLISITLIGSIVFFVLESIWNCSHKSNRLAISYSLVGFILLGICLFTAIMICCKITEPALSRESSIGSACDSYYYVGRLQNLRDEDLGNSSIRNEFYDKHRKIQIPIHNSNFNRSLDNPVQLHEQRPVMGLHVQQLENRLTESAGTSQTNSGHLNIPSRIHGIELKAS